MPKLILVRSQSPLVSFKIDGPKTFRLKVDGLKTERSFSSNLMLWDQYLIKMFINEHKNKNIFGHSHQSGRPFFNLAKKDSKDHPFEAHWTVHYF